MTRKDFDRMDPYTLGAMLDEDEEIGVTSPFATPSAILADMRKTDTIVTTLDADVRKNVSKLRPMFVQAWDKFLAEWQTFYKDRSEGFGGWTSRLWGATHEQVVSFHDRVTKWREGYEKESGEKALGPSPETREGRGAMPWKWIVTGALIVGGIVAVGYTARGIRGVADSFSGT